MSSIFDRATSIAASALETAARYLRPASEPSKSRVATVAPDLWTDRWTETFAASVTPESLAAVLHRRTIGDLRQWCDLADHARRTHPHLHAQLQLRELSVQETEFSVVPGKGSNQRAAKRAADACTELYAAWQENGWRSWSSEIVGAKYYPVGLHEVTWRRWESMVAPVALTRVAERRLSFQCDRLDPDPWALRIWDQGDPISPFNGVYGLKVSDFHPDKFVVHEPRVAGGHRASEGLFSIVCWYWLFGVFSWKQLMALLETFGRPPVIGYFNAGGAKADGNVAKLNGDRKASDADIAAAKAVLSSMSGSLRGILPDTVRLEALKFDIPSNPTQILTSDKVDAYISKAVNGTTGVTDLVAGARAAHETAYKQSMTPYRADARDVARVGSILFGRFIRANPDRFGANCPVPVLVPQHDEAEDLITLTSALEVAKRTGARIPEAWYHEQIGIPVPQDGERCVGDATAKEPATKPTASPAAERAPTEDSAASDGAEEQTP